MINILLHVYSNFIFWYYQYKAAEHTSPNKNMDFQVIIKPIKFINPLMVLAADQAGGNANRKFLPPE